MRQSVRGFTMIELIFVIVILGILAGIAVPRFINQTTNARIAAINGVAGAVASAVALAQAEYVAEGNSSTSTVTQITMNGTTVSVVSGIGIPVASNITNALQSLVGFSVTSTTTSQVTFDFSPTARTNCNATYSSTGSGLVSTTTTGC